MIKNLDEFGINAVGDEVSWETAKQILIAEIWDRVESMPTVTRESVIVLLDELL